MFQYSPLPMATNSPSVFSFFLALLFCIFFASGCGVCGPKPTPEPPVQKPSPQLPPTPTPPSPKPVCPIDVLSLTACADLLGGLVSLSTGTPPADNCCTLLEGLAAVEEAICLCAVIKASLLGANLNVPVALSWLVNKCNKKIPDGYTCA